MIRCCKGGRMSPLFNSDKAYCVLNEDQSIWTFAQGLQIFKSDEQLYASWFDKIAFQERLMDIDAYEAQGDNMRFQIGERAVLFQFIDKAMYEEIKKHHWLRDDLVKDLPSDAEIQAYFASLNVYS